MKTTIRNTRYFDLETLTIAAEVNGHQCVYTVGITGPWGMKVDAPVLEALIEALGRQIERTK